VAVLQVQGGAEGCILEASSPDGVGVGVLPAFPAKQGPDGPEPIAVSTAPDGGKVVAAQAVAAVIPAGSARTRSHRFSWEKGKEVRTLVGGNGVVIHFVAEDGEDADDFVIRNAWQIAVDAGGVSAATALAHLSKKASDLDVLGVLWDCSTVVDVGGSIAAAVNAVDDAQHAVVAAIDGGLGESLGLTPGV